MAEAADNRYSNEVVNDKKTTAGTDTCTAGTGALSYVTALGLAIHKITSNQEDITV